VKPTGLKARIRSGVPTLGSWLTLAHPAIAEIMAAAGFDWIVIDLEHSVISLRETEELMRVIEAAGVAPLIRLTSNDANLVKRVMDAGAHGIVVPMIASAAEGRAAVDAVYYPPRGRRGVGLGRAQGYGARFADYVAALEEHAIVVLQIEHVDAVGALPEILAVPGVDATIVGPYDLSASMGKPGRYDDPDVALVLERYEQVSLEHRVPMGYHVVEPEPERVRARIARGYQFIAYSVDFLFLGASCRTGVSDLRSTIPSS
jgi:2-dehydro-3-deoxyglucarate aldolase